MDDLYKGLPQSNLTYVTQSAKSTNELANMLANYTDSGFNSFKSQQNSANNSKPTSAFNGVSVTSSYSKAVHERFYTPVYSHSNYYYRSGMLNSQDDELEKFNEYLTQTNQEVPTTLRQMMADKEAQNVNKNQHQNVIAEIGNPHNGDIIIDENGASMLASNYNRSYGGRGSSGNWNRHGNYSHSDYYGRHSDYYGRHSDYYGRYDNSHYDYRNYSNSHYDSDYYDTDYYDYRDKYHNDPKGNVSYQLYDKQVYPSKSTINYVPTQPAVYLQEVLNNMQNTVTVGYHSYDRNIVTGNAGLVNTKYKVELRKTSGPNQQGWKTLQDSTNDKVTLNPLDPFNMGWTKTTQGYGNYELKITPYSPPTTVNEDGWSFSAPQVNGTPLTVSFRIAVNNEATVYTDGNSPIINSTVFMDGATKGSNSYTYDQFYGNSVPASNRKGIYLAVSVKEPDSGQYIKGSVSLKDRSNGSVIKNVPITWNNGSSSIVSNGGVVTGYAFISADSLKGQKFSGQLEMAIDQYYDSACADKASTTTIRQNVVGNGNTTLLNTEVNMQKTLNFDEVTITPNTSVDTKPGITVKVNQQNHLKDSFKDLQYSWSKSETSAGTWETTVNSVISVQPPSEGKWYLHLKANDKYGGSITDVAGPVYYSTIALVASAPQVSHFDDTDKLKVKINFDSKPNTPVTYQYRYGYKVKGSADSTYKFSEWSATPEFVTPEIGIHSGVDLVSEIKIVELNQVNRSKVTTVTLNDKLEWCIKNQANSNYNLESLSAPINNIHGSNGMTTDGFKVMTNLSSALTGTLRPNEYYYYKLTNGVYKFKKIIYFSDPVGR